MRTSILFSIVMLTTITSFSQAPAWADDKTRQDMYPQENYFVGYDDMVLEKNADLNKAKSEAIGRARADLSGKIKIRITNTTTNDVSENMSNSNRNQLASDFLSSFISKTTSFTEAVLQDIQKPDPVYDAKSRTIHALVYVDKRKMQLKNQSIVDKSLLMLQTKIANAKAFAEKSDEVQALKQLADCENIFVNIDDAMGMTFTAMGEFYKLDEYLKSKTEVQNLQTTLSGTKDLDYEECAKFIMADLRSQTGAGFKHILIFDDITYENTVYTTPLSKLLVKELTNMAVKAGYQAGSMLSEDLKNKVWVKVKGSYNTIGKNLKVYVDFIGQPTGKVFATATGYVSKDWLEDNSIAYTPAEMNPVIERRAELVPVNTSPNVNLAVYDKPLVTETTFTFWDTLRLTVKVDKPGYLRILYLSADNSAGLLLDNYHIDASRVNKFINLESDSVFRLTFAPPTYGEEDLVVAFSEKPFTKLNTRKEYVTDPQGKKVIKEVVTDNQVEAIQKTKGGLNSLNSEGTNTDTSYYTHKTLKIVLRPDKTQ